MIFLEKWRIYFMEKKLETQINTNVYILDFGNRIKIGRTKNIEQRIKAIENTAGEEVKQVFYLETDSSKEKILHYYLQEYRTLGEYFTCSFDTAKSAFQNIVNGRILNVVKPNRIKKEYNDVIKCNDFIRNAEYNLSALQQKIFLYVISKIKMIDADFTIVEIKSKDFFRLCSKNDKSGANYKHFREAIENLYDKNIVISLKNGKKSVLKFIEEPIISKRSGTIGIKISNDLKPYLLNCKRKLTSYNLGCVIPMQGKYSIRLYEILKSYQNLDKCAFEVERLKIAIGAETYNLFSNLKAKVLDTAMKEINKYGDIFG